MEREQGKVYYAVNYITLLHVLKKTGIVATTYNPLYVFFNKRIALERFSHDEPYTNSIAIIPLLVDRNTFKVQSVEVSETLENGTNTKYRMHYGVIDNLYCDLPDESEIEIYINTRKKTFEN